MTNVTNWLRKHLGMIISVIGLILLAVLTFGDIGELFTDAYWQNVGGNITSIGALTVGLVMVQVAIKQGVSEQALSAGLNTENTKNKYKEHKQIVADCREKSIYLPYFLSLRNERETKRKKREFLSDNNFTSEKMLMQSRNKKLIKIYNKIAVNITVTSIKWSTTEIVYSKNGRIEKLDAYRRKRTIKAIFVALIMMFATTLIAGGLFMDTADIPVWQKIIKFITYIITMTLTVVFDVSKNYEKGAFGVPNELEEVNSIWQEFKDWDVPLWIIKEVESNQNSDQHSFNENKTDNYIKKSENAKHIEKIDEMDEGNLQEKQEEIINAEEQEEDANIAGTAL